MKIKTVLGLGAALAALPVIAEATPVKLDLTLKNYSGEGAYAAIYVTDSTGKYVGSLWMAGGKAKYYDHLRGWYRATGGDTNQVAGITGASIGSGRTLNISFDLQDAMIDAGYQIHVDTSVEHQNDVPDDVVIPLQKSQSGQALNGRGYVSAGSITF